MINQKKLHPINEISFINSSGAYIIEASAGTGKTWTIEKLFIKALLERNQLSIEKFLVVTFTNDAVNELKFRILEYINYTIDQLVGIRNGIIKKSDDVFIQEILLLRDESIEKDIAILTSAVQNFDCASIYTIHGFCNKILTNYQFDCNVSYPFQLVNNKNDVIATLVRNFFREKIVNNHALANNIDIVYENFEKILSIDRNSGDFLANITKLFSNKKTLKYVNGKFQFAYKVLDNPNLKKLTIEMPNSKTDEFAIIKNEMLLNLYSALAKYIEQNFEKLYRKTNQLDFNDLIDILADGVRANKQLAQNIFVSYPVLFIDEFQDTDNTQWQIFSEIYRLNTAKTQGNVVIVGDPKQAIYRFRGADINVYLDAKQAINNTLTLNENRRSHPNIINFINQLFDKNNNPECFGLGIDYIHVEAKANMDKLLQLPNEGQLRSVLAERKIKNYFISTSPVQIITICGKAAEEREERLMRALVAEILVLLNADASLVRNMAILVPNNKDAAKIVKGLANYGVKAILSRRENIFATKTASDLYKILEATIDLSNVGLTRKALATYLFNIPYDQLEYFIDNSSSILGGKSIIECFYAYKEALVNSNVVSLVYLLINDLKMIYTHYEIKLNNRDVANLVQLGELIYKKCCHMTSQLEMLYWLNNKIQYVVTQGNTDVDLDGTSEELVRLDNDEDQIKVMTQHTAKGLEFDILFCPSFKNNIYNVSTLTHLHKKNELKKSELGFLKYRDRSNTQNDILSYDNDKMILANKEEDQETNRLNYVALTRAKSRIYIYLTEVTQNTKRDGYHWASKPSKISELFGFNALDPKDTSHHLFNYPLLFSEPQQAIKNPSLLPGVEIYSHKFVDESMLKQLKLEGQQKAVDITTDFPINNNSNFSASFSRQSYSSLVRISKGGAQQNILNDVIDEVLPLDPSVDTIDLQPICYKYSILNQLKGAKFGVLVHSLCENFPLTQDITEKILINANVSTSYCDELMKLIREVFDYRLLQEDISLIRLDRRINELEFSLSVKNKVGIEGEIRKILAKTYGDDHPYALKCGELGIVKSGFLSGFIDVFFEYQGKYYVLDYKTNSLGDYSSCFDILDTKNPLLLITATNHYYLQYLLYLVAAKRYLEFKLNIADASDLLGGAIYFYIRGIFVTDSDKQGGILVDNKCQKLVSQLDQLFKVE